MKLGLNIGYWGSGPPSGAVEAIAEAERLGFDSIWTAESYGSDALTPLAWWGSATSSLRLGTNLAQLSARTPTAMAMAALTLDHLSGGRFVLGLGVSGPQVVEGWYGQPFPKPLARTREYVSLLRAVWAREDVVTSEGPHYPLPFPGGAGLGKPLKPITHPLRADIPVFLGAEGPKNVALAAEIADGWFPIFYSPRHDDLYRESLSVGFARPGARRTPSEFEVLPTVPVIVHDSVEEAADFLRPMVALYVGGMGAKEANFHFDVFVRMGWEAEAHKIQDLYLAGDKSAAIAAVPTAMVEEISLLGPKEKLRDELQLWESSMATSILLGGLDLATMRSMAELVL
jgi:F420-dependent oxidoreductase-like protein